MSSHTCGIATLVYSMALGSHMQSMHCICHLLWSVVLSSVFVTKRVNYLTECSLVFVDESFAA